MKIVFLSGIYCRLYCYAQKHVKSIRAVSRPAQLAVERGCNSGGGNAVKHRSKLLGGGNSNNHHHHHHHNSTAAAAATTSHHHHSSPYHVSDHKAAITVGIIMGVFLVCWVPFFCINIVAAFCKTCIPDVTFKILTWLGYSNSAFNPIIYSIFNTEFREAFKRILTGKYCKHRPATIYLPLQYAENYYYSSPAVYPYLEVTVLNFKFSIYPVCSIALVQLFLLCLPHVFSTATFLSFFLLLFHPPWTCILLLSLS